MTKKKIALTEKFWEGFAKYLSKFTFKLYQRTGLPVEMVIEELLNDDSKLKMLIVMYYSDVSGYDMKDLKPVFDDIKEGNLKTVRFPLSKLATNI